MMDYLDNLMPHLADWILDKGHPNIVTGEKLKFDKIKYELKYHIESFNLTNSYKFELLERFHFSIFQDKQYYKIDGPKNDWYFDHEDQIRKNFHLFQDTVDNILKIIEDLQDEIISEDRDLENRKVKDQAIDSSHELAKSVTAKIVLLYELGLYDIMKKRIDEKNNTRIDLAKLIGHVIGERNFHYINSFLNYPNLDPFYTNYSDPDKDNPFTKTAIKEMKRILLECNLEVKRDYPDKNKSNLNKPDINREK